MRKSRIEERKAMKKRKSLSWTTTPAAVYYLVLRPLIDIAKAWLMP